MTRARSLSTAACGLATPALLAADAAHCMFSHPLPTFLHASHRQLNLVRLPLQDHYSWALGAAGVDGSLHMPLDYRGAEACISLLLRRISYRGRGAVL